MFPESLIHFGVTGKEQTDLTGKYIKKFSSSNVRRFPAINFIFQELFNLIYYY